MRKIVVSLVAALLMLCAALPCFAEKPADVLPEIRMEQQKQEYRTPQGQVCIVTDYRCITGSGITAWKTKHGKITRTQWN